MTQPAAATPIPKVDGGTTVIQPVSATPSGQLTDAQRMKRYEELRQRMGRPRLEVNGFPDKHYCWVFRADTNELDRLDLLGYRIVKEPNAKDVLAGKAKPRIQAGGLREDGTYVQGDVILMDVDQDVYDFLMMENEDRANLMAQSAKDSFLIEAEKAGVPTFEVDKSKVGGK